MLVMLVVFEISTVTLSAALGTAFPVLFDDELKTGPCADPPHELPLRPQVVFDEFACGVT